MHSEWSFAWSLSFSSSGTRVKAKRVEELAGLKRAVTGIVSGDLSLVEATAKKLKIALLPHF
ncbi:hypothetical protein ACFS7Z_09705 [Pontibacter toksunensis]|uniref:Uncharacterized protein n=1 Tax=Pontibacter toksunensis TaxID=1332631 RepID=A0ABW6BX65_9BACT